MAAESPSEPPVRERILDAALSLLRDAGAKKLAQPQVARLAGVPHGHLTYYFPKKLDLLIAVGRRFAELVKRDLAPFVAGPSWDAQDEAARARALGMVAKLAKDRERTRMLLRLLVEADGDENLRAAMAEGAGFARRVLAQTLGKAEDDPDVDVALAMFWGLGIQHLVFRRRDAETEEVLAHGSALLLDPECFTGGDGEDRMLGIGFTESGGEGQLILELMGESGTTWLVLDGTRTDGT